MMQTSEPWPWSPVSCPADQDFIEWMLEHRREKWMAGTVFHMGPGAHHRVPRTCEALGLECIGLTVSEEEHLMRPQFTGYVCILKNFWDLEYEQLPEINFLTLFHIGEEAWKFGDIDNPKLYRMLDRVVKGGYVFFYARSAAFDRQLDFILEASERSSPLKHFHQNKSVLVYKKVI